MNQPAVNQALLSQVVNSFPSGELQDVRRTALASFSKAGFPTTRNENWKYTNLSAAAELSNHWLDEQRDDKTLDADVAGLTDTISRVVDNIDAHWLIINNGCISDESLQQVSSALNSGTSLERLSAKANILASDPMSAFNAALLRDGISIKITADASTDKPVGLLLVDDGSESLSQTRLLINCAANSKLKIIECSVSAGQSQFANVVTQVDLADGAQLDYVRIQQRQNSHFGVTRLNAELQESSVFNHWTFDFGNSMSRNDIVANISGRGSCANMNGLYLATDKQHIDNHICATHRVGPADSNQFYRGILNGRARAVFNGKAEVLKGADGTDATQSNHNLLLSDRAEINTKPELEIYADDVKCSHGATVGQLDETALFYLQSRGLSKKMAKHVLTRAFAAEILSTLSIKECSDFVGAAINERLDEIIEDGIDE